MHQPNLTIAVVPVAQINPGEVVADIVRPLQTPTGLLLLLVLTATALAASTLNYWRWTQTKAQLKTERLKTHDLARKLKLALLVISEAERNPDLIYSREFNLDYLSMRMDEPVFREVIVAQIKMQLKQKVAPALMPPTAEEREKSGPRKVDVTFDVTYTPDRDDETTTPKVLFRIQVKLSKLPTQQTSTTIKDLVISLENFMSATEESRNWTPTIQGRIAKISWDQKAKPTPLLVIEQSNEGSNVSFRSRRLASA